MTSLSILEFISALSSVNRTSRFRGEKNTRVVGSSEFTVLVGRSRSNACCKAENSTGNSSTTKGLLIGKINDPPPSFPACLLKGRLPSLPPPEPRLPWNFPGMTRQDSIHMEAAGEVRPHPQHEGSRQGPVSPDCNYSRQSARTGLYSK